MLKKTKIFTLLFIWIAALSCTDPDIPEIINQEEVITSMIIRLTPENGGQPIMLSFRDLDGNGPNEPVIETPAFEANTNYSGEIILKNETVNPAEIITEEVEEEGADHQFFYSNTLGMIFDYADSDENGLPIGIHFNLETKDANSGSLTVVLRHEPNKTAPGVSDGDIENANGETDISVTFGIVVE